ncbi:MAG: helix-turn-helix domain-containing protein [Thermodesulfobacteriota bacterium]|nr:helix-turn-helix domain-containing protein [Thermodesulfobacteriota bacterium]
MAGESRFAELKERERDARKQIIIEAALLLFAKKHFYDVGMRDVAEEAGVSPATLYRYFPSQEELFVEAFLQNISFATKDFENMVEKSGAASIEEFALAFVDHLFQNESTFQMIAYIMLKDNLANPIMGKFDSVTKIFFDKFSELLERSGVEKDVRLYAHSFIASMTGIVMTFRNHPIRGKDKVRIHALRIAKLTAALYSEQLVNNPT